MEPDEDGNAILLFAHSLEELTSIDSAGLGLVMA